MDVCVAVTGQLVEEASAPLLPYGSLEPNSGTSVLAAKAFIHQAIEMVLGNELLTHIRQT